MGASFHFIELPQFHAERIVDAESAQLLRIQTGAQFLLFGRVRLRQLNGQDHHVIDLDGAVTHQPVPAAISKWLSTEFAELLPRKLIIQRDNDLFSFEFTSHWAEMVARYVIGIAMAISGDFDYAEHLYRDVLGALQGRDTRRLSIFAKLKERLPTRLDELHEARALLAYERWTTSHSPAEMEGVAMHLSRISEGRNTPQVLNLKAIHAFLMEKDVTAALRFLNQHAMLRGT